MQSYLGHDCLDTWVPTNSVQIGSIWPSQKSASWWEQSSPPFYLDRFTPGHTIRLSSSPRHRGRASRTKIKTKNHHRVVVHHNSNNSPNSSHRQARRHGNARCSRQSRSAAFNHNRPHRNVRYSLQRKSGGSDPSRRHRVPSSGRSSRHRRNAAFNRRRLRHSSVRWSQSRNLDRNHRLVRRNGRFSRLQHCLNNVRWSPSHNLHMERHRRNSGRCSHPQRNNRYNCRLRQVPKRRLQERRRRKSRRSNAGSPAPLASRRNLLRLKSRLEHPRLLLPRCNRHRRRQDRLRRRLSLLSCLRHHRTMPGVLRMCGERAGKYAKAID